MPFLMPPPPLAPAPLPGAPRCTAPWAAENSQCTECKPGYVYNAEARSCSPCPPGSRCNGGRVDGTCPENTYAPGAASECTPCPPGSTSLFNSPKCDCPDGETLNDDVSGCKPCPAGYKCFAGFTKKCPELQTSEEGSTKCECVHNAVPNGFGCDPCFERCHSCNGTATTDCRECAAPWFKWWNTCVAAENCPFGMFARNSTRACEACHRECDGCTGRFVTDCVRCKNVEHDGKCRASCPLKFYPDDSKVCQSCHSSCETCSGPDQADCVDCAGVAFRGSASAQFECRDACPEGHFADQKQCFPCTLENCGSCGSKEGAGSPIFDQDVCTACVAGYELNDDDECVDVDECDDDSLHGCVGDADAGVCTNTVGSYECSCKAGYEGDGRTDGTGCSDVDECADEQLHDCLGAAVGGVCTNSPPGSYTCSCAETYTGQGRKGGAPLSDQGCNKEEASSSNVPIIAGAAAGGAVVVAAAVGGVVLYKRRAGGGDHDSMSIKQTSSAAGYSRDSTVDTFDNPLSRGGDVHSTTGLVMTNRVTA